MKIKPQQLRSNLKQGLKPLYWINGDEPLLLQEAADLLRDYCREHDFHDREIFSVERGFNWELFSQATGNLSLFTEKKLLELRLGSARLDDPGKKALQYYLASPNPDYVLLITSPRIEPATLNTKWFKSLDPDMVMLQVWPLGVDELPNWLNQRLLREGISASVEALQLLVDKVEGNLLAAVQEIEKLKLLANPDQEKEKEKEKDKDKSKAIELDVDTVMQMVADSSRYNAFAGIDAALAGDGKRALKILNGLRNEGVQPIVIVGAVSAELRRLLPLLQKVQAGEPVNSVLQSARVNFKRKQALTLALKRMPPALIYHLLDRARLVDYAIKGLSSNNPWIELDNLFLQLSGITTATSRRTG